MNLNKSLLFVEIVNGFTIFNFSSLTFGLEYKNVTYLPTVFTDLKITDDYNFLIINVAMFGIRILNISNLNNI